MLGPRATFSESLLSWIEGKRFSRSREARAIASDAFADTIGCILAGSAESVVAATHTSLGIAHLRGNLLWPGAGISREDAALLNATAAHVLEFDDHEILGVTHPSAVLVPALLALAEGSERGGSDLLDAYVAGFETINALGLAFNPSHYAVGWHSTSTIAALGAAVACSILAGNSPEQTTHALGICCSLAGGTRAQFGSMTKPLHAGFAAHAAVRAALMAKAGVTAAPGAFDGQFGLLWLMGAHAAEDLPQYALPPIEEHGPIIKLHPSCAATHRTVDATIDLMRSHQLAAEDIQEIATDIPAVAASALLPSYPADEYQARFSMRYCVAATVERGRLLLEDFTPEAVSRDHVRKMAERVRITSYRSAGNPFAPGNYRVMTTIVTRSGRAVGSERLHAKGSKQAPPTRGEFLAKFEDCLTRAGCNGSASNLFAAASGLGDLPMLGSLKKLFEEAAIARTPNTTRTKS